MTISSAHGVQAIASHFRITTVASRIREELRRLLQYSPYAFAHRSVAQVFALSILGP